jgi:8-oxo-dGTP diphosphatase
MKLATLCYLKNNGHTLMMHRIKRDNDMHFGKWNGLGGKLQPGETPDECVIREVQEESGLTIQSPMLKGFITFPFFDQREDWYVFVYIAENFSGQLGDSSEGHLKWVPNNELTKLNLWEGDHIFLPWLEGDKFFSAKFVYQNGRLSSHSETFYRI